MDNQVEEIEYIDLEQKDEIDNENKSDLKENEEKQFINEFPSWSLEPPIQITRDLL